MIPDGDRVVNAIGDGSRLLHQVSIDTYTSRHGGPAVADVMDEQKPPVWTPLLARWAIVAVVALYLAGVSGQWYLTPDSSKYLLLGQSLADGQGYAIFGQPHGKFPPGFPLWIAGMTRMGLGEMLWLNLAMALTGLATLLVVYRLLCFRTSPSRALAITLAVALSYEMYGASLRQLSDIPFMLLVMLGLWGYVSGAQGSRLAMFAGTAALVASCWFRVVGFPLAVAAAVGLILEQRRGPEQANALICAALLAVGLTVSAGWMYSQDQASRAEGVTASYSSEIQMLSRRSPLGRFAAPFVHLYETGPELFHLASGQRIPAIVALVVLYAPLLLGVVLAPQKGGWILPLALLGYVGGILLFREALARYLLPVAPLIYLYYLNGVRRLADWLPGAPERWARAATIVAAVVIAMNAPKDIRLAAAVHRSGFETFREGWPELYDAARSLQAECGRESRFVATDYETVLAYLAGVPCYQLDRHLVMTEPTEEQIREQLSAVGVNAVIVEKRSPRFPYFAKLATVVGRSGPAARLHENRRYTLYSLSTSGGGDRTADRPTEPWSGAATAAH